MKSSAMRFGGDVSDNEESEAEVQQESDNVFRPFIHAFTGVLARERHDEGRVSESPVKLNGITAMMDTRSNCNLMDYETFKIIRTWCEENADWDSRGVLPEATR